MSTIPLLCILLLSLHKLKYFIILYLCTITRYLKLGGPYLEKVIYVRSM